MAGLGGALKEELVYDENGQLMTGTFMDYDGAGEVSADILTRGMLVSDCKGQASARYYVNVYPALSGAGSLGPSSAQTPARGCK